MTHDSSLLTSNTTMKYTRNEIHNLKNILQMIYLKIDMISNLITSEPEKGDIEMLQTLLEEGIRISKDLIATDLNSGSGRIIENIGTIKSLVNDLACEMLPPRIVFNCYFTTNCQIGIDLRDFKEIFHNLLLNAIDAIDNEGRITVSQVCQSFDYRTLNTGILMEAGKYEAISIKDSGKGIEEVNLPKIFSICYNSKRGGTAIGLTTAREKLIKNNCHIDVVSTPENGTEFIIYIPHIDNMTASS